LGSPHYLYGAPWPINDWIIFFTFDWYASKIIWRFSSTTHLEGNVVDGHLNMWCERHIHNIFHNMWTPHLNYFRRRHIWKNLGDDTSERHVNNTSTTCFSGKNANLIWFYFKTTNLFLRKKYILFIILSIVFTEYKSSCNVARIESVSSTNCNACFC